MADGFMLAVRPAKSSFQFIASILPRWGARGQYFVVRTLMPRGYAAGMELRHLRYFVAVAEELSFTRAARKLRVAQPALSRQVRQLEDELGTTLFERNRRETSLTMSGAEFLKEAVALLAHADQAVRTARANSSASSINIGYVYGLFHSFVPPVIERLRRALPDHAVNLFDMSATEQAEALAKNRLDAGFIGFAREADAAGLEKEKIGACNFIAALPKTHRAARLSAIPLQSLASDFFFAISETSYPAAFQVVARACESAGFRPKILQSAERGFTLLNLVAAKCGVALVPEPLCALPHPGVIFRPLARPITEALYLAWRKKPCAEWRIALRKVIGEMRP
jgi:DNA-binding transcriptional LysR family regulator